MEGDMVSRCAERPDSMVSKDDLVLIVYQRKH